MSLLNTEAHRDVQDNSDKWLTYQQDKQEIYYGSSLIYQSTSECVQPNTWSGAGLWYCNRDWTPTYRYLTPYRVFNENDYAYTDNGIWKSSLAFQVPGITEVMPRDGNGYSFFNGAQSFFSESEAENCGGFLLQGNGKIGFLLNQDVSDRHIGKLVKFNGCSDYKTLGFEDVIGPLKIWNYSRDFIVK